MEHHVLIPTILLVIAALDYLLLPGVLMKPLRNLRQLGLPAEATIREAVKGRGWRYEYEVGGKTLSGFVTERDLDQHKGFQTEGDLSGEKVHVVYDPSRPAFARMPVQIDGQLRILNYVIKGAVAFLVAGAAIFYVTLKPGV